MVVLSTPFSQVSWHLFAVYPPSSITRSVNPGLATDRDRRRRVTDERTVRVASVRLGERDAPPHTQRSSKDFDRPLVGAHRLEVADLDLDRSVAGAGRGACVDGATGGGIEQRAEQAAVDHADRVV